MKILLVIFLVIIQLHAHMVNGGENELKKNQRAQELIKKIAHIGLVENPKAINKKIKPYIDELHSAISGDRIALLKQIVLFLSEADNEEDEMGCIGFYKHLNFSNNEKIQVALDILNKKSLKLDKIVREALLNPIDHTEEGDIDFSVYLPFFHKKKTADLKQLVQYMYELSPEKTKKFLKKHNIDTQSIDGK